MKLDVYDEQVVSEIRDLIASIGGDPHEFDGELVKEMIQTCLKFIRDEHNTGQLKLINSSLREMRYAYSIFNKYPKSKRISIFGSARTPEDHPDYRAAATFGELMAKAGWMSITGAASGIMKAGIQGAEHGNSFGLAIRLPFEEPANSLITGDPKLISFRYFFTRKLMFLSHSDAIAAFPGGVGTMDEVFESLTLMQTGKSVIVPLVFVEGEGGSYWKNWEDYLKNNQLACGWISPDDLNLFYRAQSPEDAYNHIIRFYSCYHSSRYVKDLLVLRLNETLTEEQVEQLNDEFSDLIVSGKMELKDALPQESDHLNLPRLVFHHNRNHFGRVRLLIDQINAFSSSGGAW